MTSKLAPLLGGGGLNKQDFYEIPAAGGCTAVEASRIVLVTGVQPPPARLVAMAPPPTADTEAMYPKGTYVVVLAR